MNPVKPSSAATGNATSVLENADFTRQNVATPIKMTKIITKKAEFFRQF
jgi:hypothetical protein